MKQISGHTVPFAVLGYPVGHTLSPVMHNASIAALGMDAVYLAFEAAPDRLLELLPMFKELGFGGLNLTVPLKEVAFKGFQAGLAGGSLAESAVLAGAVNTVEFTETGMIGHTTDGIGFLRALEESFGAGPGPGERVFVLGCGGAGRTVALAAALKSPGTLLLTDMDPDRVSRLCADLQRCSPQVETVAVSAAEQVEACRSAEWVLQASPIGMRREDPVLLPPEAFGPGQRLFDLIYMYPETALMRRAREQGATVANGLGMLLHQGARSFEIWTGRSPDTAAMRKALEEAVYGTEAV